MRAVLCISMHWICANEPVAGAPGSFFFSRVSRYYGRDSHPVVYQSSPNGSGLQLRSGLLDIFGATLVLHPHSQFIQARRAARTVVECVCS